MQERFGRRTFVTNRREWTVQLVVQAYVGRQEMEWVFLTPHRGQVGGLGADPPLDG